MNFKIIYTEAFQAPGYSYRTSNADYSGSISELEPEKLKTFQSTLRYNINSKSFIEATGYYNRLNNLITRTQGNYYINYGKLASYGLELDYRQSLEPFFVFANYSLLLPDTNFMDAGFIIKNTFENEFRHFPRHSANAGISYSYKELASLSLNTFWASSFKSLPGYNIENRLIFNAGFEFDVIKRTKIYFRVYNLFDKKYILGDPSVVPIEQPGRWWLFSVAYSLR